MDTGYQRPAYNAQNSKNSKLPYYFKIFHLLMIFKLN